MRKLLLIALLFPMVSFSQIQEVKVEPRVLIGEFKNGPKWSKLEHDNTTCYLTFTDETYTAFVDIKLVKFDYAPEDLEYLYKAMKETMEGPEGKDRAFILGEYRMLIRKETLMGFTTLSVATGRGVFSLTRKGIDRLFGKR